MKRIKELSDTSFCGGPEDFDLIPGNPPHAAHSAPSSAVITLHLISQGNAHRVSRSQISIIGFSDRTVREAACHSPGGGGDSRLHNTLFVSMVNLPGA